MYDPKTFSFFEFQLGFTVPHVASVYSIRTTPIWYANVEYDPSAAEASFTVVPSTAKDAIVNVAAPAAGFTPMLDVHVTAVSMAVGAMIRANARGRRGRAISTLL